MFFTNSTEETIFFEGEPGKYPEVRINADTADEEDKEVLHYRKWKGRQRSKSHDS
jgi:hypothetical protein